MSGTKNYPYTNEQKNAFLNISEKYNHAIKSVPEEEIDKLAKEYGRTHEAIRVQIYEVGYAIRKSGPPLEFFITQERKSAMENLNKLIDQYGYTRGTVANELGVTELAVYNWLNGLNGISRRNQVNLNDLLEKVKRRRVGKKGLKVKGYKTKDAAILMGIERQEVNSLIQTCLPEVYELKKVSVPETGNYIYDLTLDDIEILIKAKDLKKKMTAKEVKKEMRSILKQTKKIKIPKYIAEIVERYKREKVSLLDVNTVVWNEVQAGFEEVEKLKEWLREKNNSETFIVAWTEGYSIEEVGYVIVITEQFTDVHPALGIWSCYVEHTTTRKDGSVVQYKGIDNCQFNPVTEKTPSFSKENHSITTNAITQNVKYKFTKNEIKEIDERFLPFAKEVK